MANLRQFQIGLQDFAEETEEVFIELQKAVTLQLYRKIVERTPVDTGIAQSNWNITRSSPDFMTQDTPSSVQQNFNKTGDLDGLKFGETTHIANGLPYIVPLEEGHSTQAPPGVMVALSVEEVRNAVGEL